MYFPMYFYSDAFFKQVDSLTEVIRSNFIGLDKYIISSV